MGALYHREKTGEATTVDVSLFGTGLWSMGAALALSLQLGIPWRGMPSGGAGGNPLVGVYRTSDDRHISLCCLQAGKYWADFCEKVGHPELVDDERFADAAKINEHAAEAREIFTATFASKTFEEWKDALQDFTGQWAPMQDVVETVDDPQTVANGYVQEYHNAEGTAFKMVTPPVQYGGKPATPKRAPEFNEHGDEILESIGLDMEQILELKIQNVVA